MTRTDIARVMRRVPGLNDFGIGLFDSGRGLDAKGRAIELARHERSLLEGAESCTRVCEWLRDKGRRKTINNRHSSYGLKHLAEREIGYTTNGAFIAAAIHSGFAYRLTPGSPNVGFGISEKSLRPRAKVAAALPMAAPSMARPAPPSDRPPAPPSYTSRLHQTAPLLLDLAREQAEQLADALRLVPCTGAGGVTPCIHCQMELELDRMVSLIAEVEGP